jgi:hypothetical protein
VANGTTSPDVIAEFERTRSTNHARYGTITRYRVVTADGMEREIIHGQTLAKHRSPKQSADLTIGTAPPLSLGPEGIVMHFLLKSMEAGIDGIVFGPERSRSDVTDEAEIRSIAATITFRSGAAANHRVCDRLAEQASTDLSTMMWTGVSLGAMKGITFAAMAPERGRTMVYSQFVVPACPNPQALPTEAELKRFQRDELGAMARLSAELLAHDMRDRMFQLNTSVARSIRPGLLMRYARSMPRDSVSRIFTEGWRAAVVSGDAGTAASKLPTNRLATFELFDHDDAGTVEAWRHKLAGVLGDSIRVTVKRGHHTDSLRLSHQQDRARHIGRLIRAVRAGTPVDELVHPYA